MTQTDDGCASEEARAYGLIGSASFLLLVLTLALFASLGCGGCCR